MKKIIIVSLLISAQVFALTGDPSSLKIKVYRFAVSENTDCSNPKIVIDNSTNATYKSMLDSPSLGGGVLANGTYPCVMIEMSDNIKFTPDSTFGTYCVGGTEYTLDVCGGNSSYIDLDGVTQNCTGDNGAKPTDTHTDTKVVLYLSTAATSTGGGSNGFQPPTSAADGSNGFKLASALIVSGTEVGIFDVNGTGKVESDLGPDYCEFAPPAFSFSKR